jgi:hypothetical protein
MENQVEKSDSTRMKWMERPQVRRRFIQ